MSASPADFELYSRVTGTPLPRTPQEQMQMAPMVHHFTRNYARQPQQPNFFQETAENLGKLALLGLAGGAVYGLSRQGGQKTPEEPAKGQIGTVNSATVNLNPDYSPPTVEAGPEFSIQENISSPKQYPVTSITQEQANAMSPSELSGEYRNLANATSDPALKEVYNQSADNIANRSNAITTTPATGLVEDPWDDSNVSVMPREVQKSPVGQAVSGQIERIRRQGGGRDLRTAAPGLAGGIALRGVVPGLSGGGLGVGEGGALGQGAVKGFWGGVSNLPVVSQAVEGLENVGNMGIFGNTLGDAASTVFHGVPGLEAGTNIGAVKLAELGGLGAGVVLDSAVKDTLAAGANVRRAIDPSGKMVPTIGQTVDFHNNTLVPGGKRMAGALLGAISTSQQILPTSSAQASGNLIAGTEPQVTTHPDVPPGETDQAPSRGGNVFSNLVGNVKNAWDENTRIANEIALEQDTDILLDQIRSESNGGGDNVSGTNGGDLGGGNNGGITVGGGSLDGYDAYQEFAPKKSKTGGGMGIKSLGVDRDGNVVVDWWDANPNKQTPGGYVHDSYLDSLKSAANRDALITNTANPDLMSGKMTTEQMDDYQALVADEMDAGDTLIEGLEGQRFGSGAGQVSAGKFANRIKNNQQAAIDFLKMHSDSLRD